jgi:type IX secretion system substrate protein
MMKKYFLMLSALTLGGTAFAQQSPTVHVNIDAPYFVCDTEACTTLTASLANSKATTGYDVNQITYQNLYPYSGGTSIPPVNDDVFGPAFPLGFNFCFYGNTYSSIYIGTNGVISFDAPVQQDFCPWNFQTSIPATDFPIKNAIYGVYQDTEIRTEINGGFSLDPNTQNVNYYTAGTAPNRYMVINFNELPQFNCGMASLQTSQVVLYESSNIIDVYVKNRTGCDVWNGGRGVIGVQNAAGTLAAFPTNRNTGNWDAANEAWRFMPNGSDNASVTYQWQKDGILIPAAMQNTLTICEAVPGVYEASITFIGCSGIQTTMTETATIEDGMVAFAAIADPVDLSVCSDDATAVFDLTSNATLMLNATNPFEFEVFYYNTYQDAVDYTSNNIPNAAASAYTGTDDEVIYARVTDYGFATDCFVIKSFELEINEYAEAPEGNNEQDFEAGDTLEDLEVEGDNISWWDAPSEGNELPDTTPLVNGVTYYAESTNEAGCPSTDRNAGGRLAITVTQSTLGTPALTNSGLIIAPNPVKDVLSIDSKQNITSVEVYNLIGQRVLNALPNTQQTQINMSALSAGTYMMKVTAGNSVKTVKVVKD